MSTILNLSNLPNEILVEILLLAAYSDVDFAHTLTRVSSWTNKLAQRVTLSTISILHTRQIKPLMHSLGLIQGPFPFELPIADLFRLSFKYVPRMNPTRDSRERARLIRRLWLIPFRREYCLASIQDHIYTRLLLQVCVNVEWLALTGTAFAHFLLNESSHFHDVTTLNPGIVENKISPYPRLTHLTLLETSPTTVAEMKYNRAQEYVKIFKQLTHFTTYGFYHKNGLPVATRHFRSLTHVAIPLILSSSEIADVDEPSTEEIYACSGGKQLLLDARQIQMLVYHFPPDGQLNVRTHMSSLTIYHPPHDLILGANRLDNRAYALPIDGLNGLHNIWRREAKGGQSMWEAAEELLLIHRDFESYELATMY